MACITRRGRGWCCAYHEGSDGLVEVMVQLSPMIISFLVRFRASEESVPTKRARCLGER
jgi:hypothetical protein